MAKWQKTFPSDREKCTMMEDNAELLAMDKKSIKKSKDSSKNFKHSIVSGGKANENLNALLHQDSDLDVSLSCCREGHTQSR